MDSETITLIAAIADCALSVAMVVAFFILCANVAKLKVWINPFDKDFDFHFNLYVAMGDKGKAKELLVYKMRNDKNVDAGTYFNAVLTNASRIEQLVTRYKDKLDLLGISIDQAFIDSLKPEKKA